MTPQTENGISLVMQSLGRRYVQYFSYRNRRSGTLWEGRYKATLIDSEKYLLTCYRYVELNPVRAGMVDAPGDYQWSSYHHNGLGEYDPLITPHDLYIEIGSTDELRQQRYTALFETVIEPVAITGIREATKKGWVFGSDRFKARLEALIGRQLVPRDRGGDRKSGAYQKTRKINRPH
jgi:putative transposase